MVQLSAESIVEAIQAIALADGPVLVHCAAGKDRTGLVVAFALTAVGVEREAVLDDYRRTNANMAEVLERFQQDDRASADRIAGLLATDPELFEAPVDVLAAVLARVEDNAGGMRAWLIDHGLTGTELDRLEGRLVEPEVPESAAAA